MGPSAEQPASRDTGAGSALARPLGDDSIGDGPGVAAVGTTPADLDRLVAAELHGSLNLGRTVLRLLHLVTTDLADWAAVAVAASHGGTLRLAGGEHPEVVHELTPGRLLGSVLGQVLRTGDTQLVHVEREDPVGALETVVGCPPLAREAAVLRPADVLVVSLHARGIKVGALVLARGGGRGFGAAEVALAEQVAERAAVALDSARLYEDLARVTSVLEASLRPPQLPEIEGIALATMFRPAAEHLEIGGDFYDAHGTAEDLLVVLGDVCGKGVEASVLNGRARQSIQTAAVFDRRPAVVLEALNQVLTTPGSQRFVTVVCARVRRDVESGHLDVDVAVAGHQPPLVVRADGRVEVVDASGPLAGVLPSPLVFVEDEVRLGPGDVMLLFSDGLHEARGADGELFGLERLVALVAEYAGLPPSVICEAVEQHIVDFLGGEGHDDMAMLALGPAG